MHSCRIALLGNPNSGKTSLFNSLTGSRQRVGNWPGVTVEHKTGYFDWQGQRVQVDDLPGVYSTCCLAADMAMDEHIVCDYLLTQSVDVVVNIVDGSNLERNLYLTSQLLEQGIPVVVALNMMDVVRRRGASIDIVKLQDALDCSVVPIEAHKSRGIASLQEAILKAHHSRHISSKRVTLPPSFSKAARLLKKQIEQNCPHYKKQSSLFAIHLLEGNSVLRDLLASELDVQQIMSNVQHVLQTELTEDTDTVMADARYEFSHKICKQVLQLRHTVRETTTHYLDRIILNRWLGIPIFLSVIYMMFFFAINIGGAFQDFFDLGSQSIFVQGSRQLMQYWHWPDWVVAVIANGMGRGINTVLTFIPVLAAMFLFLSFLEGSGYMARAAFIMDRLMRYVGLPGRAFVPMIVGFGCNVPAVMGARILANPRDRILTIMMTPFMSCGARLAIFAVFATAFFPTGGQNIIFALYLIGIAIALLTGFVLRHILLPGTLNPLVMELPVYHFPTVRYLLLHTWSRLNKFLFRAGKVIVPVALVIGFLNTLTLSGELTVDGASNSLLANVGQLMTPIFKPMGITADNWPATVGLITGTLAKEVVIVTLNTLYAGVSQLDQLSTGVSSVTAGLKAALATIPENLRNLVHAFANPVLASSSASQLSPGVYGVMYQYFGGPVSAFAYLLFVLLYVPCVSTAAAIGKELNRFWAWLSISWSTCLAYAVAVIFYQALTFTQHVFGSILWFIAMIGLVMGMVFGMRYVAERRGILSDAVLI